MTTWTPADLLPGLWVAALAALLALGLRRWFDPAPRWCWMVWGGVLLVLFGPALFGGRVLLPLGYLTLLPPYRGAIWEGAPPGNLLASDVVLQITPWLVRVREAYAAGEWPLWNHLAGAGEPLLGNPQSQAFQPLAWLALPFPVPEAAGVIAALRVLVPLVFTFLLLRRQGISEAPALWGSLAFGLSGFLHLWLGWPLASSATFLPVLLYGLAIVARRGLGRDQALLAAATACVVLVGHPETGLHVVVLGTAFALSLLRETPAERRGALLRSWVIAGWVGLGLAAPALMTAADALPRSLRASLLAARHAAPAAAAADPAPAVGRLLPVAAPNAYGNNRFGHYWGNSNMNEDAAGFTGTAALLAFLLAFLPYRKEERLPQERVLLGAALVCLVVLARPPGLVQLLEALPVLRESYSYHSRLTMLLNFVVAYLAACTWERWRRNGLRPRPVLLAAAALAALILWGYLAHPHPEDPDRLALLRYGTLALQLAVLAVFTVALARPSRARWAPGLLALAVAGELLAIYAPVNPSLPARLYYPETEPLTFVRQRLDPWYRMAGVGGALRPNLPSVYGLADPRSSNPAKPAAYAEVTRRINRFPDRASDGFLHPEDPLYGLLGVRFVMTAPRLQLPPPLKPVLRRPAGWVYRRPGALPRLFLPAAAAECPEPRPWPDCTAAVRDFGETALVRRLRGGTWKAAAPRDSILDLGDLRPAHLTVRARLAEPRLLASSLYQDDGWKLLAEGRPLPTATANGPFLAAWLPAGDTRLDLLYRPSGFLLGMAMAALALAGAAILWLPPPRRVP
ncbi:MAG TPA: hypothetical protein VEL74_21785 [Thermoanaerobaculia bacterium]|nr:hypothetical protein [Thermoanaerobaculia bacterium]